MAYGADDDEDELAQTLMGRGASSAYPAVDAQRAALLGQNQPSPVTPQPAIAPLPPVAPQPNPDDTYKPVPQGPAPKAPVYDLAARQALDAKYAAPGPTHTDPNLKPKWYERLQAGVGSAMMAFGKVPGASEAGDAVLNRRFNNAEADYQQQRTNTGTQLSAMDATDAAKNRAYEQSMQSWKGQGAANDQAAQEQLRLASARKADAIANATDAKGQKLPNAEGWQPDTPGDIFGPYHATAVDGTLLKSSGPPAGSEEAKSMAKRAIYAAELKANKATGHKYTADEEKFYLANGSLKQPSPTTNIRMPSAEAETWSAYVKSLGHPPTTQDVLAYKRGTGTGGTGGVNDASADAILQNHLQTKQTWADQWTRRPNGKYFNAVTGKLISGQEFNDKIEGFRTSANTKLAKIGYQIDDQGNVAQSGPAPGKQPAASPAPAGGVPRGTGATPPPRAQTPQQQPVAQQAGAPNGRPASGNQLPAGNGRKLDRATAMQFFTAAGNDPAKARQLATGRGWKP